MQRYKYMLSGSANCYDGHAENEKKMRTTIRKTWKLSYYEARKVDIWETKQTVDEEIAEKKKFFADVLKANPQLCLTDF